MQLISLERTTSRDFKELAMGHKHLATSSFHLHCIPVSRKFNLPKY